MSDDVFLTTWLHVGLQYLSTVRPTYMEVLPIDYTKEAPAVGGRVYVQAKVLCVRRAYLGPTTCHDGMWWCGWHFQVPWGCEWWCAWGCSWQGFARGKDLRFRQWVVRCD